MTGKRTEDARNRGMQMLGIELPHELVAALDALKEQRGKSRNRMITEVLTAYVKKTTIRRTA